jgi:uncharacterized protein
MSVHLAAIWIYPVKSLDGCSVTSAQVLPSGALALDRRWALLDEDGQPWTAKRSPQIHQLRFSFQADTQRWQLQWASETITGRLPDDADRLGAFCSRVLQRPLTLVEDAEAGWPDDIVSSGPTVISTATLAAVAGWFPNLTADEVRRRFRANLEITGVAAFEEDRLFGPSSDTPQRFRIGPVDWLGVNPCQRCVVPSRDSHTGEIIAGFSREFSRQREQALPDEVSRDQFTHYYRLSVNTRLAHGAGSTITSGDPVVLASDTTWPSSARGADASSP